MCWLFGVRWKAEGGEMMGFDLRGGCAGWNAKLAREGKALAHATAVGESGEEAAAGAAMGLLKRKRTSPPESPAPSKRRILEEADFPVSSSSDPVEGTTREIEAGKCFTLTRDTGVNQLSGQSNQSTMSELAPEELARLRFEKDVDALRNRIPSFVENVSHGQGLPSHAAPPPETSGPAVALTRECEAQAPATPHLVPSHAGWFRWARIHQLERVALPEFFSAKEDTKKTPETYMDHRSSIMKTYRENPQKAMKFEDVRGLLTGDVSGSVRLFRFLDNWGLINYQAVTEFSPFSSSRALMGSVEEKTNGALSVSSFVKPALANLFNFEAAQVPAHKLLSICPSPASDLPISSLAEAAVQESLAAPAVEYHCNSCQADCSKRRYHCQKQADFDLCPDCYSDGKFGQGMTSTDFLRMDALTENADVNGGGWSDQETLLLLEALELYGDNWNEIAEHVATKSKAQCILHFIRLPIEDPFLEDMEAAHSVLTVQPSVTVVSKSQSTSPLKDTGVQAKAAQNESHSSSEPTEAFSSNPVQDSSVPMQKSKKDRPDKNLREECEPFSTKPEGEGEGESDVFNVIRKAKDLSDVHTRRTVSESTGSAGSGGLIAFVEAGNPVMTQVAFLAAMVGPRVAASAAQAALKSLAEDDPVGFLSEKNSFALDSSDICDSTLATERLFRLPFTFLLAGSREKPPEANMARYKAADLIKLFLPTSMKLCSGHQSIEIQVVSSTGGLTVSSDGKPTSKAKEERKKSTNEKVPAGTLDKTAGEGALTARKSQTKAPTNSRVVEQDVPSVAKVRTAAANALASAAVKAKLLADQEEREIQRLVAGVIENQLKKLELKLKHFSELESMLGKECELAEKARAKVYAERARIVASRLGSPSSVSQLQATGSTAASHSKLSSHLVNSVVAQPRPAVFTFGPTGLSAPAAVCMTTSGLSSSSLPAGTSSQQGETPPKTS